MPDSADQCGVFFERSGIMGQLGAYILSVTAAALACTAALDCISMASLNIFSMDKTFEKAWDEVCVKNIAVILE